MPNQYKSLLINILKPEIQAIGKTLPKDLYPEEIRNSKGLVTIIKSKDNNTGIPQGGIISPILMN